MTKMLEWQDKDFKAVIIIIIYELKVNSHQIDENTDVQQRYKNYKKESLEIFRRENYSIWN